MFESFFLLQKTIFEGYSPPLKVFLGNNSQKKEDFSVKPRVF